MNMTRFFRRCAVVLPAVCLLLLRPLPSVAIPPDSPRLTPVVRAVQLAAPAVVNITSTSVIDAGSRAMNPLEQFFGPGFQPFVGMPPARRRNRRRSV